MFSKALASYLLNRTYQLLSHCPNFAIGSIAAEGFLQQGRQRYIEQVMLDTAANDPNDIWAIIQDQGNDRISYE